MRAAPILSMTSQDVARLLLSRQTAGLRSFSAASKLMHGQRKAPMRMTTEEAFVKTLQMHGIKNAFGIIGSAMMPISDLFPKAGIKFWDCAHECNAGMMADGYTRTTGKMSMMIAQNGPGITNFLTPVKTAYWNHTPLLLVTPQAANKKVDINGDRIGLTTSVDVGIQGDAGLVAEQLLQQLAPEAGSGRAERAALVKEKKAAWAAELESLDHELDDEGTTWNPSRAWRAIMRVMPKEANMSSDIGNNCAIGNAYPSFASPRKYLAPGLFGPCGYGFPAILGAKVGNPDVPVVGFAGDGAFGISVNEITACGRGDWPPVTMVVFRNFQWGAEKRNTTLWYDDNFVGTELNKGVEYAEMAKACGLKGVKVQSVEQLERALSSAIEGQMKRGETTLVEVLLNQELGEPFRRDAMKAPVQVAPINASDMAE
ncbi:unnamed protein product [Effrenium voratum]|uniref:Sulfoacetaldehyde acetyltransferase n=1 Tax=Effrenium voratum TaxID=2562239 RepID=A0AA36HMB6_9DINO|nr:unnamed protein product [Effrenium voratum]